jgi:glycosyltransferase involved in cell wall biosynthesis
MAQSSPNIEFAGWLDHERLAALYREAVAVIVPSLCFEGGPLVIIEGFSYGTPTIGRRLGALPELLDSIGGGMTYTDDNSLRQAMEQLLDNPERRREMGERARKLYCDQFTPNAHMTRYFEIIEEGMRRKRGQVEAT